MANTRGTCNKDDIVAVVVGLQHRPQLLGQILPLHLDPLYLAVLL